MRVVRCLALLLLCLPPLGLTPAAAAGVGAASPASAVVVAGGGGGAPALAPVAVPASGATDPAPAPAPASAVAGGSQVSRLAGGALVLLGAALLVAELMLPTLGLLGFAGVVVLVGGIGLLAGEGPAGDWPVPPSLLGGLVLASLVAGAVALRLAVRAQRRRVAGGTEALPGAPARVLDWADGQGHVWLDGERWQAAGPPTLHPGATVRVRAVHGLTVRVDAATDAATDADAPADAPPPTPVG